MSSKSQRAGRAIVDRVPTKVLDQLARTLAKHPRLGRIVRKASGSVHQTDSTITRGVGAGLKFNASEGIPGYALGTPEPDVQAVLAERLKPGDVFYDVGASIGFFTVIGARLVGPEGTVVAIDANPLVMPRLLHNIELNEFRNVTCVEAALGDAPGEGVFHGDELLVWGTVTKRVDGDDGPVVTIKTLDQLVEEGFAPPTFVKLDIEGSETVALPGMTKTLAEHRPVILCELHGTHAGVRDFLVSQGYSVSSLETGGELAGDESEHILGLPPER